MSFIKKALLISGVPVRPTTKKNRYAKRSMKELQKQTKVMQEMARREQQR
jgi:hypothetical protein